MTEKATTRWPDEEHGVIVICAIRYAMGRQTYMPSLVQRYVQRNWSILDDRDRDVIRRDVAEAIGREERSGGWLGHECDVVGWKEFLTWLNNH